MDTNSYPLLICKNENCKFCAPANLWPVITSETEPALEYKECPICGSTEIQDLHSEDELKEIAIIYFKLKNVIEHHGEKLIFQKRRLDEFSMITRYLEDQIQEWMGQASRKEADYMHVKNILGELVALKRIKDEQGKTPEYEERQPKVWKAAFKLIDHNIKPSMMVYMDALIDVDGKLRQTMETLSSLVRHEMRSHQQGVDAADHHNNNTDGVGQTVEYMRRPEFPAWIEPAKKLIEVIKNPDVDQMLRSDYLENSLHAISVFCQNKLAEFEKESEQMADEDFHNRQYAINHMQELVVEIRNEINKMLKSQKNEPENESV